jgi:tetratricopeptide (TPR) repeat protein
MSREAIAWQAEDVGALRQLARDTAALGHCMEAERILAECIRIAPEDMAARFDLARVFLSQHKAAPMLPLMERLISSDPEHTGYLVASAAAHSLLGQSNAAIGILREIASRQKKNVHVWLNYGHVLRAAGRGREAECAYRRCLELNPGLAAAWLNLADIRTCRLTVEDIEIMEKHLGREDLGEESRIQFEFALGRAYEGKTEYCVSFGHYARGNALQRARVRYDREIFASLVTRLCSQYTRAFFGARVGWGSASQDPIFIVGVPRSGSTLVEQILASHSEVEGCGEIPDILGFAVELWARTRSEDASDYPEVVARLPPTEVCDFAARYLARSNLHRVTAKPRFVDKMLCNVAHVGFIGMMFPNARIVDVRRHPLACGTSCFKQLFPAGQKFTYGLEDFGCYYRDYVRLLRHFDAVLPGRIYRLSYERLVADPRAETKRLLQYCGLKFEEQCLRFYENSRVVHTISAEQVRMPIYLDGLMGWRKYEPWLSPLKEVLGGLVRDYLG